MRSHTRLHTIVGVSVLALTVGLAARPVLAAKAAKPPVPPVEAIRKSLLKLPYYGVFDFLAFEMEQGSVTLSGYAYHGALKSDASKAVGDISGINEIGNNIEVLPASQNDDRIRWQTFYRIYTDAFLSRYAPGGPDQIRRELYDSMRFPGMHQPLGMYSIHIIVRNGHTTLFGVVDNEGDKQIAEVRAREVTGVFSVENELVVPKKDNKNTGE